MKMISNTLLVICTATVLFLSIDRALSVRPLEHGTPESECSKEGDHFYWDCNTCTCSQLPSTSGWTAACTLIGCFPLEDKCYYNKTTHENGDTFLHRDGIHTCTCNGKDGNVICPVCQEAGKTYEYGESWPCADGCNTCWCVNGGVMSTTISCSDMPPPQYGLAEVECKDSDSHYYEECNGCSCMYDHVTGEWGGGCTRIGCQDAADDQCYYGGKLYNKGDTFPNRNGCGTENDCICTGVGGYVLCTPSECPAACHENDVEYQHGESWTCDDGCNLCWCSDGKIASTGISCSDIQPEQYGTPEAECEDDDDTFFDECNSCMCIQRDDGWIGGCTRIGCPDAESDQCYYGGVLYNKDDTFPHQDGCGNCICTGKNGVVCSPSTCPSKCMHNGQEYDHAERWECDDCNMCQCFDGAVITTSFSCPEVPVLPGTADAECETEDDMYYDQCNSCMCMQTASGWLGGCTRMACKQPAEDECYYKGKLYKKDDTIKDGCTECRCTGVDGYVLCSPVECPSNCFYNGKKYQHGQTWYSEDGCNVQWCENGVVISSFLDCDALYPSDVMCAYGGKTYKAGQTFDAVDGCNKCTCQNNGDAACTEKACTGSCSYGGITYLLGQSFPDIDGCNDCRCEMSGDVSCTDIGCGDSGTAPVSSLLFLTVCIITQYLFN